MNSSDEMTNTKLTLLSYADSHDLKHDGEQ